MKRLILLIMLLLFSCSTEIDIGDYLASPIIPILNKKKYIDLLDSFINDKLYNGNNKQISNNLKYDVSIKIYKEITQKIVSSESATLTNQWKEVKQKIYDGKDTLFYVDTDKYTMIIINKVKDKNLPLEEKKKPKNKEKKKDLWEEDNW